MSSPMPSSILWTKGRVTLASWLDAAPISSPVAGSNGMLALPLKLRSPSWKSRLAGASPIGRGFALAEESAERGGVAGAGDAVVARAEFAEQRLGIAQADPLAA